MFKIGERWARWNNTLPDLKLTDGLPLSCLFFFYVHFFSELPILALKTSASSNKKHPVTENTEKLEWVCYKLNLYSKLHVWDFKVIDFSKSDEGARSLKNAQ